MLRFFQNLKIWIFGKFLKFFDLDLEKKKSTILDGFFPYLAQMITSMRGCVAYNDLWHWPISSRSFGLGLENRVCSVASTVLDGFFPYLVQMITSMRRCFACDDPWPWPISSRSFDLDFGNRVWGGGYPRRWHRLIYLVLTLTHWGRVTHICVSKLSILGSDNGLSPGRRQAII